MIEHIIYKNEKIALILRNNFKKDGIEFLTPLDYSQQLGYMNRPKGYNIDPHIHNFVPRRIFFTSEVIFIKSGKVRVDFYLSNKDFFSSTILYQGDFALLISGGHGFEMLEDTEIIEVKQGPYTGDSDKTKFKKNLNT